MAESRRSFFLEECTKLAVALAHRPGRTGDELRADLERIVQDIQSEDVVDRLDAIERLAAIEPKVRSFVANER